MVILGRIQLAPRVQNVSHLLFEGLTNIVAWNHERVAGFTLAAAAERGPIDFPDLLLTPGVGARTVRSLAMVAEVVHGAPYRFRDPARFSLANGGKDRHPYPVPIKVYDETISVMKSAVRNAKLGRDEEVQALKRLDDQARRLERTAQGPSFESFVATERAASPLLDGRSVFGWEKDLTPPTASGADGN